jgi:predicted membrane protein
MYLLLDILLVVLGASMLWYRERLARYIARVQQHQSRAWPWAYPGIIGRFYTSEKAWRNVFIPILAFASLFVGVLWLWKGAY